MNDMGKRERKIQYRCPVARPNVKSNICYFRLLKVTKIPLIIRFPKDIFYQFERYFNYEIFLFI